MTNESFLLGLAFVVPIGPGTNSSTSGVVNLVCCFEFNLH